MQRPISASRASAKALASSGVTHAVATIQDAVALLLMREMIGKPGAGVCPVRGHSNVQGDRTMGIWEKMPESFLSALDAEFGITCPRKHGLDAVDSIRAMRDGQASVFIAMGGNFVAATPDTDVTESALRNCSLTVHISTKLNRSHLVTGRIGLILPSLGRTDKDVRAGKKQMVTVEDSMSVVPTSITTAPSAMCFAVMRPGIPAAATTISAAPVCAARSVVCRWQTVTVALARVSRRAVGTPTTVDRPTTATFLPR